MLASQRPSWATIADHFARKVDEPLMTLLGAAHSLANKPAGADVQRLAESAARNAALVANMVRDLQKVARCAAEPVHREMVEVIPAIRTALAGSAATVEGDEMLVAMVSADRLGLFVRTVVSASGRPPTVAARKQDGRIVVEVRTSMLDRPLDAGLLRTLAEPLGPVSIAVEGSISVSLPALTAPQSVTSRASR